jgi:hypothetical protein
MDICFSLIVTLVVIYAIHSHIEETVKYCWFKCNENTISMLKNVYDDILGYTSVTNMGL